MGDESSSLDDHLSVSYCAAGAGRPEEILGALY